MPGIPENGCGDILMQTKVLPSFRLVNPEMFATFVMVSFQKSPTNISNDMTKNLFRILLFLLLPLAGQAKDADSLRVLWVGNSYTYYNDMPAIVQKIAATQKVKVSCTRFLKGGERFSGHLTNQKLLKALAAGGWDYVVLQEQSSAPAMPTRQVAREVYPQARTLDSLVHAVHPTPV